jgi:hypothetical protein
MLRSVRSLRPDKALQLPSASLGFIGAAPPDFAPLAGRLCRQSAHSFRECIAEFRLF